MAIKDVSLTDTALQAELRRIDRQIAMLARRREGIQKVLDAAAHVNRQLPDRKLYRLPSGEWSLIRSIP